MSKMLKEIEELLGPSIDTYLPGITMSKPVRIGNREYSIVSMVRNILTSGRSLASGKAGPTKNSGFSVRPLRQDSTALSRPHGTVPPQVLSGAATIGLGIQQLLFRVYVSRLLTQLWNSGAPGAYLVCVASEMPMVRFVCRDFIAAGRGGFSYHNDPVRTPGGPDYFMRPDSTSSLLTIDPWTGYLGNGIAPNMTASQVLKHVTVEVMTPPGKKVPLGGFGRKTFDGFLYNCLRGVQTLVKTGQTDSPNIAGIDGSMVNDAESWQVGFDLPVVAQEEESFPGSAFTEWLTAAGFADLPGLGPLTAKTKGLVTPAHVAAWTSRFLKAAGLVNAPPWRSLIHELIHHLQDFYIPTAQSVVQLLVNTEFATVRQGIDSSFGWELSKGDGALPALGAFGQFTCLGSADVRRAREFLATVACKSMKWSFNVDLLAIPPGSKDERAAGLFMEQTASSLFNHGMSFPGTQQKAIAFRDIMPLVNEADITGVPRASYLGWRVPYSIPGLVADNAADWFKVAGPP